MRTGPHKLVQQALTRTNYYFDPALHQDQYIGSVAGHWINTNRTVLSLTRTKFTEPANLMHSRFFLYVD